MDYCRLNIDNNEFCLRYYNQNDIPKVVQVLFESIQHRPIYHGICLAVSQYWKVPANFLPLSASTEANMNSANIKTTAIQNDNVVPALDASFGITHSPAPEGSGIASNQECSTVNIKLSEETRTEETISAGLVSHQSDLNCQSSINMSNPVDPAKCSLVNGQCSNYGHADGTGLPMNFSLQARENNNAGFGKCDRNVTDDFRYMGFSYKPMSYINYYMHADFAASASTKFATLSSEESKSDSRVSVSQRKTAAAYTYLQTKAFSLTASRFFWPSSEKKLVEVPRERCGWCFSCKASVSSKRGCMLNHAAICATKSAFKILTGFSPIRSGEGILPSIATYIIYIEECLHGLTVGPFLDARYRKHWRKQVEQATTFSAIKPLLLKVSECLVFNFLMLYIYI